MYMYIMADNRAYSLSLVSIRKSKEHLCCDVFMFLWSGDHNMRTNYVCKCALILNFCTLSWLITTERILEFVCTH